MNEELLRTLSLLGPYANYEVWEGVAPDTESEPIDLPDGIKRLDVIVIGNPLKIRFYLRGKGVCRQIIIPNDNIYTVFISPDRFTVQNYFEGSPAYYSVVAWM